MVNYVTYSPFCISLNLVAYLLRKNKIWHLQRRSLIKHFLIIRLLAGSHYCRLLLLLRLRPVQNWHWGYKRTRHYCIPRWWHNRKQNIAEKREWKQVTEKASWNSENATKVAAKKCINHLVEYGLVRAQKAPFDIAVSKANVENLAICGGICIITIRTSIARKAEVCWNLIEVLS